MLKRMRPLWFLPVVAFVILVILVGFSRLSSSPRTVSPTSAAIMPLGLQPTAEVHNDVVRGPAMAVAAQPTSAMAAIPTSAPVPQDQSANKALTVQTDQKIPKPVQQRVVLKNATLNMTVENPAQSVSFVTQMAEQMGGWVVSSNATTTERDGHKLAQATISVRVPVEQFSTALERIKTGAISVETENIAGDDVTLKYVDLSSQLNNLEATEAQFQKIMSTATNINDVLTVQRQLTEVQGQIETIKGQLKYFSEAAAYSLISLTLTQKAPPPPPPPPPPQPAPIPAVAPKPLGLDNWQPGQIVLSAADTIISAAQILLSILIWLVVVAGPIVVPMSIAVYLLRRFRARPAAKQPQVQAE